MRETKLLARRGTAGMISQQSSKSYAPIEL
jgi:hypothetical protein